MRLFDIEKFTEITNFRLEKKLAARRAKVTEWRQKQEEIEVNSKAEGKDGKKQIADLVSQLNDMSGCTRTKETAHKTGSFSTKTKCT